jgi:hypothetical protein
MVAVQCYTRCNDLLQLDLAHLYCVHRLKLHLNLVVVLMCLGTTAPPSA